MLLVKSERQQMKKSDATWLKRDTIMEKAESTEFRYYNKNTATLWPRLRGNIPLLYRSVFCWDQSKDWDQTAQLWTQSGVEINQLPSSVIADVIGKSSLISPYFFVYFW